MLSNNSLFGDALADMIDMVDISNNFWTEEFCSDPISGQTEDVHCGKMAGYPSKDHLAEELDEYRLLSWKNITGFEDIEVDFKLRYLRLTEESNGEFSEWIKIYNSTKLRKVKAVSKEIMCHLISWESTEKLERVPAEKIVKDLKILLFKLVLKVKRNALRRTG
jgi:hypothetical protein